MLSIGLTFKPQRLDFISRFAKGYPVAIRRSLHVAERILHKELTIAMTGNILHKRSGKLLRSWSNKKITKTQTGFDLTKGSSVAYSRIHEVGGMTGAGHKTRIPARRYVSIAMERSRLRIINAIEAGIDEAARRA